MQTVPIKTYVIRHKITKDQWITSSGKSCWKAQGHAKTAWLNSHRAEGIERIQDHYRSGTLYTRWPRFDEQDLYEIVELRSGDAIKLEEAIALLKRCSKAFHNIESSMYQEVDHWLYENDN